MKTLVVSLALILGLTSFGYGNGNLDDLQPPPQISHPIVKRSGPDGGLLQPEWFGPNVIMGKGDSHGPIAYPDFFYMKPRLDLTGHNLKFENWEDPEMLDPTRDAKDFAKAADVTESLPSVIRGAMVETLMKYNVRSSRKQGDILVQGRVVDCNAGAIAAKILIGMGAGQQAVTFDVKFIDANTKELLLAVHHRIISGTIWSNIESKDIKWAEEFGEFLAHTAVANPESNPIIKESGHAN